MPSKAHICLNLQLGHNRDYSFIIWCNCIHFLIVYYYQKFPTLFEMCFHALVTFILIDSIFFPWQLLGIFPTLLQADSVVIYLFLKVTPITLWKFSLFLINQQYLFYPQFLQFYPFIVYDLFIIRIIRSKYISWKSALSITVQHQQWRHDPPPPHNSSPPLSPDPSYVLSSSYSPPKSSPYPPSCVYPWLRNCWQ